MLCHLGLEQVLITLHDDLPRPSARQLLPRLGRPKPAHHFEVFLSRGERAKIRAELGGFHVIEFLDGLHTRFLVRYGSIFWGFGACSNASHRSWNLFRSRGRLNGFPVRSFRLSLSAHTHNSWIRSEIGR